MRVHEVRFVKDSTVPASKYTFSYGDGNNNHKLGTGLVVRGH